MKIETRDSSGKINGYLIPIWNVLDGPRVDQVYLTVIHQGMHKGPHLHLRRRGLFKCIKGDVLLVWQGSRSNPGSDYYFQRVLSVGEDPMEVAPGTPAALYNVGIGDAYILNMPSPSWRPDDVDEHEVKNWNYHIGDTK